MGTNFTRGHLNTYEAQNQSSQTSKLRNENQPMRCSSEDVSPFAHFSKEMVCEEPMKLMPLEVAELVLYIRGRCHH